MIKVVHAELFAQDSTLPKLMADWSSCVRFAYNRFREGENFNAVRQTAKPKYLRLSTRQVSDAVTEARGKYERTKDRDPMVFGGKNLFAKVCKGEASAEEWRFMRDGQMYARGDRTKTGNPTFRVVKTETGCSLRVTVGMRDFRSFSLFIPHKFRDEIDRLLASGTAYNVRLRRRAEKRYKVTIDFEVEAPPLRATFRDGGIGVDTNPDRIALCIVSADGNRLASRTLVNTRMFYGSTDKTRYDVSLLVKEITEEALRRGIGIAAENLKFKSKFVNGRRKANRMKARFVWRSFLRLLERKCVEKGIEFRKVNPAFTSLQGRLKYRQMFNVPTHEAAAYVIGRRAMGFSEKVSIYQLPPQMVRNFAVQTLLEENGGENRRFHSWSLWRKLDGIPALTERRARLLNPRELGGNTRNGSESLPRESVATTGRYRKPILQPARQRLVQWLDGFQAEERRP